MTRTNRTFLVGRALLLALTLALGIVTGIQPAAACSDTAERYPMLIGSGYEGEPCEVATTSCTDASERFPMLIGSGYEGEGCRIAADSETPNTAARSTTSATWQATMLDGSGYERDASETALSESGRD
jgi:hypothetical protein